MKIQLLGLLIICLLSLHHTRRRRRRRVKKFKAIKEVCQSLIQNPNLYGNDNPELSKSICKAVRSDECKKVITVPDNFACNLDTKTTPQETRISENESLKKNVSLAEIIDIIKTKTFEEINSSIRNMKRQKNQESIIDRLVGENRNYIISNVLANYRNKYPVQFRTRNSCDLYYVSEMHQKICHHYIIKNVKEILTGQVGKAEEDNIGFGFSTTIVLSDQPKLSEKMMEEKPKLGEESKNEIKNDAEAKPSKNEENFLEKKLKKNNFKCKDFLFFMRHHVKNCDIIPEEFDYRGVVFYNNKIQYSGAVGDCWAASAVEIYTTILYRAYFLASEDDKNLKDFNMEKYMIDRNIVSFCSSNYNNFFYGAEKETFKNLVKENQINNLSYMGNNAFCGGQTKYGLLWIKHNTHNLYFNSLTDNVNKEKAEIYSDRYNSFEKICSETKMEVFSKNIVPNVLRKIENEKYKDHREMIDYIKEGHTLEFGFKNYYLTDYKNKLDEYKRLMKEALILNGPIGIGIDDDCIGFHGLKAYKEEEALISKAKCIGSSAGHAVTAVGWKKIKGEEYLIVKNNWGKDWGYNGYFFIKFDVTENAMLFADEFVTLGIKLQPKQ